MDDHLKYTLNCSWVPNKKKIETPDLWKQLQLNATDRSECPDNQITYRTHFFSVVHFEIVSCCQTINAKDLLFWFGKHCTQSKTNQWLTITTVLLCFNFENFASQTRNRSFFVSKWLKKSHFGNLIG